MILLPAVGWSGRSQCLMETAEVKRNAILKGVAYKGAETASILNSIHVHIPYTCPIHN